MSIDWIKEVYGHLTKEDGSTPERPASVPPRVPDPSPSNRKEALDEASQGLAAEDGEINLEALRAKIVKRDIPTTTFDDIKGQDEPLAEIKALARQIENPEIYGSWGSEMPAGALLVGPPGTGKTMMAEALVNSGHFAYLKVKCSDVNNKFFGNPEKFADAIFDIAIEESEKHATGRGILFLDEVDALLKRRSDDSHAAADNVMAIFLDRINEIIRKGHVTILAATNRGDMLDPAFISRMDIVLNVPLPTKEGVSAIFEARIDKHQGKASRDISGDIAYDVLGERLVGLSGRDIKNLVGRVLRDKASLQVERAEARDGEPVPPISTRDIVHAAVHSLKVVSKIGARRMRALREEFEIDVDPGLADDGTQDLLDDDELDERGSPAPTGPT